MRAIGGLLATRTLRTVARRMAVRQLDRWAARAVSPTTLADLLTGCVTAAGADLSLPVQALPAGRAGDHYRLACAITLQNFDQADLARTSHDARWVRWSFRAVQYRDAPEVWLEALVWHPAPGHAEALKPVFRAEAATGREMFVQLLATALRLTTPVGPGH